MRIIMSSKQIKQAISNVEATLAIEGHKFTKEAKLRAKSYLSGKISSEEALRDIREKCKKKMRV